MADSVTSFLEQYEWGYPFDQNEDTVDRVAMKRELDRRMVIVENQRFYEPISVKTPQKKKESKRHFLGC